MRMRDLARACGLMLLCATSATAADRSVRIGVINDQSSIYADMGGPGSVVAAQLAVEDSGLKAKGWTVDVLVADHGNKADVASSITREWFDTQGVDVVADVTNSAAALAVNQLVREKNEQKATIPAEEAFRPLADGGCPLVAAKQP